VFSRIRLLVPPLRIRGCGRLTTLSLLTFPRECMQNASSRRVLFLNDINNAWVHPKDIHLLAPSNADTFLVKKAHKSRPAIDQALRMALEELAEHPNPEPVLVTTATATPARAGRGRGSAAAALSASNRKLKRGRRLPASSPLAHAAELTLSEGNSAAEAAPTASQTPSAVATTGVQSSRHVLAGPLDAMAAPIDDKVGPVATPDATVDTPASLPRQKAPPPKGVASKTGRSRRATPSLDGSTAPATCPSSTPAADASPSSEPTGRCFPPSSVDRVPAASCAQTVKRATTTPPPAGPAKRRRQPRPAQPRDDIDGSDLDWSPAVASGAATPAAVSAPVAPPPPRPHGNAALVAGLRAIDTAEASLQSALAVLASVRAELGVALASGKEVPAVDAAGDTTAAEMMVAPLTPSQLRLPASRGRPHGQGRPASPRALSGSAMHLR